MYGQEIKKKAKRGKLGVGVKGQGMVLWVEMRVELGFKVNK